MTDEHEEIREYIRGELAARFQRRMWTEAEELTLEQCLERINTLDTQVQFLVDYLDEKGELEEHCFVFPDGETVHATQTMEFFDDFAKGLCLEETDDNKEE